MVTYASVSSFFLLISLLICSSLLLIWHALLLIQGLPSFTKNLSDLTFNLISIVESGLEEH